METLLWQRDNLSISFDKDVPCLIWKLSGFPGSSEVYREAARKLYDFIIEKYQMHQNLSVINDASEISSILPEDIVWAKELATRKLKEAQVKIKYRVVIKAQNPLGKFVLDEYLQIFKEVHSEYLIFSTKEEAKNWLKQLNMN